jgi:pyruvate/2-oxoglutarate dehydrogenase complex dihydrolipoamide dehydrogenase (E3) component
MQQFDAMIIGSGQSGTPLVFRMSKEGKKVAFIEKEHFGGTCVNNGCTPTKAYVASARRMWDAGHGEELGVHIPRGASVDLKKVKKRKDGIVRESAEGIRTGAKNDENIMLFEGEARFSGEKTVTVNGKELTAEEIFINVGARAIVPEVFKDLDYLTNKTILQLEELPEHLIIIGGSYVGLEFGQMFRRFGSRVTIVEKGPRLIAREDEDVSDHIRKILQEEKIVIRLNADCTGGKQNEDGSVTLKVDCEEGEPEITGTHILLAVGRRPNTDLLHPEATGLTTDERGYIPVNDFLETNVKGIFALGDCNGRGAFTHTSYNDYKIIAGNKFEGKDLKVSDRIPTYCLYIDPPLGRAGMTRNAALENGYRVLEAETPMSAVSRANEKGETRGLMRILVDAENHKILGASILGVGGDEVISSILGIMYADVPWTVLKNAVIPHPTVSEYIPTILNQLKEIS